MLDPLSYFSTLLKIRMLIKIGIRPEIYFACMLTRIETKMVHHYYLSIGIQFLEMRKQRKEITVNKKRDGNAVDGRQDSTLWLIYHASGAQAGAGGVKGKLITWMKFVLPLMFFCIVLTRGSGRGGVHPGTRTTLSPRPLRTVTSCPPIIVIVPAPSRSFLFIAPWATW